MTATRRSATSLLLQTTFSVAMLAGVALLAAPTPAYATSGDGTDELLSDLQRVPPVVIFVVDMSADMNNSCDGVSTNSCWTDTVTAIENLSRHYDFARFGVVGTATSAGTDTFTPIAPVGSSYAEISADLAAVSPGTGTTRNMAETLEDIGDSYLGASTQDGDGVAAFGDSPIGYACTSTYIVVLAKGAPVDDDQIGFAASHASISPDITCDSTYVEATSPDSECLYDQLVTHLYNTDWSSLSGTQRAVVHTIGLGYASGTVADDLYYNAELNTVGEGTYTLVSTGDEILGAITNIFAEIEAGTYTRSSPVITTDGAYMIYDFYEMTGDNPLAEGHVRAYSLVTDPTDPYYGTVDYTAGDASYGGAVWDGGDLLVSRIVEHADHNEFDDDGIRHRDIYFWDDNVATKMSSQAADQRLSFDNDFVTAVGTSSLLDSFLDTSRVDWSACVAGSSSPEAYDLDLDCDVDDDDLQAMVDFGRGLPTSTFRYIDQEHGSWKLQDSPYAVPVVVSARDGMFSMDTTYQAFLAGLEADTSNVPTIVLVPANDGMLHAFRLEDDPDTVNDEKGQELWGWIPGYLLQREHDTEWANHLVDQMFYGRTFMFDATPVVEDVWIDSDGDGTKAADGSEWHRVVVVSQGLGGPVTMALDITSTRYPTFLWEETNTTDATAMGYTTSRPVVFNVNDGSRNHDQWVAMWGGGRAAGFTGSSGTAYYQSAEANLYMWNVGDTPFSTSENVGYSDAGDNIGDQHPEILDSHESASALNYDSDSNIENTYISAALAVVDADGDGDADVMYFPVTTAYTPTDQGGAGPSTPLVPGSSWMYKALINTADVDDLTWCEWYDPLNGTDGSNGVGARPEVYYAATTSWRSDGSLGVYWGTGTPFNRDGTDTGYFFAMYDADPTSCTSTAQPITCNGNDGYLPLDSGEGLTSDPLVYAGVVYFTTYTPNADRCEDGTGKVYGIKFDDCSPGIDTNGDGVADSSDDSSVSMSGYTSGVTVGNGTVYYGTATPTTDGSDAVVDTITATNAVFMNTATVAWMEMY